VEGVFQHLHPRLFNTIYGTAGAAAESLCLEFNQEM